jgi:hypothetical protein
MATIFFSHSMKAPDLELVRRIGRGLCQSGKHSSRIPIGAAVAGSWRAKIMKALLDSDALIALLTSNGVASPSVLGEIGTARAMEYTRGMLVLPILCGVPVPDFIREIWCFELKGTNNRDVSLLVTQLAAALSDNIRLTPRIFVSHQHKDQTIAAALTSLLESAFVIGPRDIRCTSVAKYALTPGARTSEELRSEIAGAELVIGILTPDTSESNYVLCELGAAWGRDVATFPLLARGATPEQVPSPLNERHSVSVEKESNCLRLIDYIASRTSLQRRTTYKGLAQRARELARVAAK